MTQIIKKNQKERKILMTIKKLEWSDRAICKSLGRACQRALWTHHYDPKDFFPKLLNSVMFDNYEIDGTVYSQSPEYILDELVEELENKGESIQKLDDSSYLLEPDCIDSYSNDMYWMGYLFQYWKMSRDVTGEEILKYDIDLIFENADVLHTQSINYALDIIEEDYLKQDNNYVKTTKNL